MESTKDSKTTKKATKTTIEKSPVEKPEEDIVTVDNIDKDDAVVTGQSGDEPVTVVMKPPKKSKVGVIIGIVALLLFLIGGGCLAAWYFCIYNSPEVVAYDAVRQLITAEHVVTDGTIRIASSEADRDGNINVAELELESSSLSLPNSTSVQLNISERDSEDRVVDNHEISLDLGLAVMADGIVYLQVENLADTLDQYFEAADSELEDLDQIGQFAYAMVELIDNQWWEISLSDILDQLGVEKAVARPIKEFYDCMLTVSNDRTGALELYNANRFINIEKTGQSAVAGAHRYKVSLDHAALAGYINGLPETAGAEKTMACFNELADNFGFDTVSAKDFPEVSVDEIDDALKGEYEIFLDISDFGHQLKRIEVNSANDDTKVKADLGFEYRAAEVTAPSDYRPITDLFEEVFELAGEYFYGYGLESPTDLNTGILTF